MEEPFELSSLNKNTDLEEKEKNSLDLKDQNGIFDEFENEEKEFYQETPSKKYTKVISI